MTLPAHPTPLDQSGKSATGFLSAYWRRVLAVPLRHYYLHKSSWQRLLEMVYWPIINIAVWGFVSLYMLHRYSEAKVAATIFIAGVVLTEVFIRVAVNMLLLFLEEVWSRNLGHMFASPLSVREYGFGLMITVLIRVIVAMIPALILVDYLFGYSIFDLGWPLLSYTVLLLINATWYGALLLAILLRYGMAAEWVCWMGTWFAVPLMSAYYPVSVLPVPLQYVAWSFPGTHVFASMQSQMATGEVLYAHLWGALGLNGLYALLAAWVIRWAYQSARNDGRLMQMAE